MSVLEVCDDLVCCRCLLPSATRYPTMHCVTNPYEFSLDGLMVLGTSGQPVEDMYRFGSTLKSLIVHRIINR